MVFANITLAMVFGHQKENQLYRRFKKFWENQIPKKLQEIGKQFVKTCEVL
ncbi:MAG: hypothetical protein ACTSUK_01755 [Promethearchaeota archaeon]